MIEQLLEKLKLEIHQEVYRAIAEMPFEVAALWLDCNVDYGEVGFSYNDRFDFDEDSWNSAGYGYKSKGWEVSFWEELQDYCIEQENTDDGLDFNESFMKVVCESLANLKIQQIEHLIKVPLIVMCIEHNDSPMKAIRRFKDLECEKNVKFAEVE